MTAPGARDAVSEADHRRLAVALFNHVWTLLDRPGRTAAEDDEMLHAAHASRWHWAAVGEARHLARGEWQCSRVYAVLRRPEPACHHACRCLEICQDNAIGDFDLAAAHEALARASAVAGHDFERDHQIELARAAAALIRDEDDRRVILRDLESLCGG